MAAAMVDPTEPYWSCDNCTLNNSLKSNQCEACDWPKNSVPWNADLAIDPEDSEDTWACKACTLLNPLYLPICAACDQPKEPVENETWICPLCSQKLPISTSRCEICNYTNLYVQEKKAALNKSIAATAASNKSTQATETLRKISPSNNGKRKKPYTKQKPMGTVTETVTSNGNITNQPSISTSAFPPGTSLAGSLTQHYAGTSAAESNFIDLTGSEKMDDTPYNNLSLSNIPGPVKMLPPYANNTVKRVTKWNVPPTLVNLPNICATAQHISQPSYFNKSSSSSGSGYESVAPTPMDTRRKQPQKKIDKTKFSPVEMPIAQLLFSIENNAGSLKISGTQGSHEVSPKTLAALSKFLSLPKYLENLLKDRPRAQCLLRWALGFGDDGRGGNLEDSPIAPSLPTLPFLLLKELLDETQSFTTKGVLLRRSFIDIGVELELLNCLAAFTHQSNTNDSSGQSGQLKNQSNPDLDPGSRAVNAKGLRTNRSATRGRGQTIRSMVKASTKPKGVGYTTGVMHRSWDVQQSIIHQSTEEDHVTVLLQVLASYIGMDYQSQNELPSTFANILSNSCLLPVLCSFLRNDSVLEIVQHLSLYRAVLQVLRAMVNSSQLAPLLIPKSDKSDDPSIVSLLTTMCVSVDTYVKRINSSNISTKYSNENERTEGLSTLLPDIQELIAVMESYIISKLADTDDDISVSLSSGPRAPVKSTEDRYMENIKKLQFAYYTMITDNPEGGFRFDVPYHYESTLRKAVEHGHPARFKRLAAETSSLSTSLPLSFSSSVFVRSDDSRNDIMKVLITGPAETPYANGCFEFDIYFPPDYPNTPMLVNLQTTGRGTIRFNPNLYKDGKVCLSLLNTWSGSPDEKWNSLSTTLQVLVSIQSLILVADPWYNEPGFENSANVKASQSYNACIRGATLEWAILDQIRNPSKCFQKAIHTHFWLKRHEIVAQIEDWIKDIDKNYASYRCSSGFNNPLPTSSSLRKNYAALRKELEKLPAPEGLEDLVGPLRPSSFPEEQTVASVSTAVQVQNPRFAMPTNFPGPSNIAHPATYSFTKWQ